MDPNVTLADARQLAQLVQEDGLPPEALAQHAGRLAELFTALDEWLTRGGHVPSTWESSTRATLRVALTDQLQRLLEPVGWVEHEPKVVPTRDEAIARCSFTTLAGTTSWDQHCVNQVIRGE